MAAPESIDRKVLEALETHGNSLSYIDAAVLFEGSPFDAVDQAVVARQEDTRTVLAIGMVQDPAGLRTGARKRASSRLVVNLLVLHAFAGGTEVRRTNILELVDIGVAVAGSFEDWGAAGLRTASGLSDEIMTLQVGDIQVLADPDGNFGGREIPLTITINRNA